MRKLPQFQKLNLSTKQNTPIGYHILPSFLVTLSLNFTTNEIFFRHKRKRSGLTARPCYH